MRFEVAQLLGIDEIGLDLGPLQLRQDAHQIARLALHEIGQGGDAEAALDRAEDGVEVVDGQDRPPLAPVGAGFDAAS